ncbi:MAG: O-antigen ligase family protein [Hyphomonadaceae bacterium]
MAYVGTASGIGGATNASARAAPRVWEIAGAALCLVQFSEPLFAAIAQSQGLAEPPGFARIFFAPVYAFLAYVAWRDRALAWRAALAAPLLLSLLGLAFASTLWSIDSGATLRRSVWLGATMLFALYLAWRFAWRDLVQVLAAAFLVLIAGSYLVAIVAPGVGTMPVEHPGAWSGLWTHKNTLGGLMALAVALNVAAAIAAPQRRRLWIGAACAAFGLIVLSTSKTALVAALLGVAIIAACALMRRGPIETLLVSAGLAIAASLAATVVILAPDILVAMLGRDLTLTGRTDIWDAAAPAVAAQPWLGYGYYAFWLPEAGPAYYVREAVRWQVASAHSGWLETALALGRAGVALFALQFAASMLRGARSIFDPVAGLWAPAFLAAFAMYTLSESHVLQANNLFWLIYVAVTARLALDAAERRAQ